MKREFMLFWFNSKKKLEEFLQRPRMTDEDFLSELGFSGTKLKKVVKDYRSKLGDMFQVPPEKIYPNDKFGELSRLQPCDWDLLEIVLFLEDSLKVELDDEKVPDWNGTTNVGSWVADLLSKCFTQNRENLES
ncbi:MULTISPECIES: hypothetical protein [Oscillatoriales]|uniref:Uncharacterized protein n=1 Tax=Oxynema aestuarii AP17 TaxID=2064643 RepID=A0A6H1U2H0_9CYAN|nr:hypothetical protein [Oxynema aestuarii]MCT7964394.1 hypothetical protein [Laspinema sp. D2b]QIZ73021.1 hypothetical protein HCG48_22450 [Oxynema aestuarii AP17]